MKQKGKVIKLSRMFVGIRRILRWVFFPLRLVLRFNFWMVKKWLALNWEMIKISVDALVYPFLSLRNFLKAGFIWILVVYLGVSMFVMVDYLKKEYGHVAKFGCMFVNTRGMLKSKVVRVVGGYSEGSGFFIDSNRVMTNFHVIDGEPSPKVVLPNGEFETPVRIVGDKDMDLAVLWLESKHPELTMYLPYLMVDVYEDEPLFAAGYPLGTFIPGEPTVVKGSFIAYRRPSEFIANFLHTSVSLEQGMSGGPLVDKCGRVVGVNTISLAGQSFYIDAYQAFAMINEFTDQDIKKIVVDPTVSPEEGVRAFYTYLMARRMEEGFNLLSKKYLEKTSFEEWTSRFTDVLDVRVHRVYMLEDSKDRVVVKFSTKNWVDGEVEIHNYEGIWQTVLEDGVYKLDESRIVEVAEDMPWNWYYE